MLLIIKLFLYAGKKKWKKLTKVNAVIEGNRFGLQARRSGMNLLRSSIA